MKPRPQKRRRWLWGAIGALIGSLLSAAPPEPTAPPHDPERDLRQFRQHYQTLFPQLAWRDYVEGVYALDPIARQSWQAIEEFPPYEPAIEAGERAFQHALRDGAHYADCLPNRGLGIAQRYPVWDKTRGEVITLPRALNDCRRQHGEAELRYDSPELLALHAYLSFTSRGLPITIDVPRDDPRALAAYAEGRRYYFTRRGQLEFSCATCHWHNAGKRLRAEVLSPSLGHATHWPVYRLQWGEIGSLHRRFNECHRQIRAATLPEQSAPYRHLEYFLTYLGNGLPFNGPSTRK